MFKRYRMRSLRGISLALAVLFLHQQVAFTQGPEVLWTSAVKNGAVRDNKVFGRYPESHYEIPYDVAQTTDSFSSGGKDVVIQIQDAHASLAAQYSIVKLLDSLSMNYDLSFIALEGARGYIDTSILKSFPDKGIREKTASFLVREGRMSAGEFFAITRDEKEVSLYGVEDDELYRKNVESFRKVAEARAAMVAEVDAFLEELDKLGDKAFSPELKKVVQASVRHRDGKMSFADYWKEVNATAARLGVSTGSYGEISRLLEAISLERKIDFVKANVERKELIDRLSDVLAKEEMEALVLRSLEFKENRVSQSDFHAYLVALAQKNGIPADGYSSLILFSQYVSLYEGLDIFALYQEVAFFEAGLREKLYGDGSERRIYEAIEAVRMLKKLYCMELAGSDYSYMRAHRDDFDASKLAALVKEESSRYGIPVSGGYDLWRMVSGIEGALEFYGQAESRDAEMLANTVERMRKENVRVAALITGGYHTKGISELMKSKGLSYLVVVPKFDKDSERPYVAILTNRKKAYQELLDSGRYQLAVEAYFYSSRGDLARMKTAIFYALGVSALEGEPGVSAKERWIDAYAARYAAIAAGKHKDMEFEPVSPEAFASFLRDKVKVVKMGDAIMIADSSGSETVLVSLEKKADTYEIGVPTEEQKIAYRSGLTAEAAGTAVALRTLQEGDLRAQLASEDLEREVASRLEPKDGIEKVIDKLKARGIQVPNDWRAEPATMAILGDFAARVLTRARERSVRVKVVTHDGLNAYILLNLPKGLWGGTLDVRRANIARMFPNRVDSGSYGLDYGVAARVIPINGMYENYGVKAQIGLGRVYGEPVIYADADYADAQSIKHEFYEMREWERMRSDMFLEPEAMRTWILANIDKAREAGEKIHRENPYVIEGKPLGGVEFIYANSDDIIISAAGAGKREDAESMKATESPGAMTERPVPSPKGVSPVILAKIEAVKALITAPRTLYEGRNVEIVSNAAGLIVVGDNHADAKATIAHLEAAGIRYNADRGEVSGLNKGEVLVFTGDYIDRGNEPVETVALVMGLKAAAEKTGARVITLEGNHDYMMRYFMEKVSDRLKAGEKVGMREAEGLALEVVGEIAGSARVVNDFTLTVKKFHEHYYGALSPITRVWRTFVYGDFGAAFLGMKEAGVVDFFMGLKRLAVVDNHVLSHAYLPLMYRGRSEGADVISGKIRKEDYTVEQLDAEIERVYSDLPAMARKAADLEEPLGPAPTGEQRDKHSMARVAYLSAIWPYVRHEGLVSASRGQGWTYEARAFHRRRRTMFYSFLQRELSRLQGADSLPQDVPFHLWVGHEPYQKISRGNVSTYDEDVIMVDGGMTGFFRTGAGMRGAKAGGGIVRVDAYRGDLVIHALERSEEDLIEGKYADAASLDRGETPEQLLPGPNAAALREIKKLEEGKEAAVEDHGETEVPSVVPEPGKKEEAAALATEYLVLLKKDSQDLGLLYGELEKLYTQLVAVMEGAEKGKLTWGGNGMLAVGKMANDTISKKSLENDDISHDIQRYQDVIDTKVAPILGEDHPQVVALRDRISDIRTVIQGISDLSAVDAELAAQLTKKAPLLEEGKSPLATIRAEADRTPAGKEFSSTVGIPAAIYDAFVGMKGDMTDLCNATGVDKVIRIEAVPRSEEKRMMTASGGSDMGGKTVKMEAARHTIEEARMRELREKTRGERTILALLDTDLFLDEGGEHLDAAALVKVLREFATRAKRDIIGLVNPEVSAMTPENLRRAENMAKLPHILRVMARLIPEGECYDLKEKGVFNIRAEGLYGSHVLGYSTEALNYAKGLQAKEDVSAEKHIVVTAVDKALDLKLLASSIRDRRTAMGVAKGAVDPIKDLIIIKNSAIAKKLAAALDATGLGEYLTEEDVIVVDETKAITPGEVLELVRAKTGERSDARNIALGAKEGIIELDLAKDENSKKMLMVDNPDSMVMVRLDGGLASQLYKVLIEMIADPKQAGLLAGEQLTRMQGYNVYFYLPKMEVIDLKAEVEQYEAYVSGILSAA